MTATIETLGVELRRVPAAAGEVWAGPDVDGHHIIAFCRPWKADTERWLVEARTDGEERVWSRTVARGVGSTRELAEEAMRADLGRVLRLGVAVAVAS